MTERISTDWLPEQDLDALLDALTSELLAASEHEISAYVHHDADERQDEIESVRRMIAAADAEAALLPVSLFKAPGLRAYLARNQ